MGETDMPFDEKTKLKVKEKAFFRCCRCQSIGIDVHHIIPEKDQGTSDFDNAAPLCQNCHAQFGDNPSKRKEIKQMRDFWYKMCEKMYSNKNLDESPEISQKLNEANKNILLINEQINMLMDTILSSPKKVNRERCQTSW